MSHLLVKTSPQRLELLEGKSSSGNTRVRGVSSKVDTINKNKRVYRKSIMEREIATMLREATLSSRIGAVNHPTVAPRIEDLCLKYTDLKIVGNDVLFEAEIIPTQRGKDLELLLASGVEVGVSSRGMGSAQTGDWDGQEALIVEDNFRLMTFDCVVDPSVADARIAALEGFERIENILKTQTPAVLEQIIEKVIADQANTEEDASPETPVIDEAVWSTAYIDKLPDSAFLYVKDGVRKFPVRNAQGDVDLPHVDDAKSRISGDTELDEDEKKLLLSKATQMQAIRKPKEEASADSAQADPATEDATADTTTPAAAEETPAEVAPKQEDAPETNPLTERVTSLETELQESKNQITSLTEEAAALREGAQSLSDLLSNLTTAIQAELADGDWDDTAFLANFGQQAAWRQRSDVYSAAADTDEATTQRAATIESLKDAVPALLTAYRANRVKAVIAEKTRTEKFGRAIAAALEASATTVEEVDELLPTIKEMVLVRLNTVPNATTQGTISDTEATDTYTEGQHAIRRSMGIED
jgi:hypothetical protein